MQFESKGNWRILSIHLCGNQYVYCYFVVDFPLLLAKKGLLKIVVLLFLNHQSAVCCCFLVAVLLSISVVFSCCFATVFFTATRQKIFEKFLKFFCSLAVFLASDSLLFCLYLWLFTAVIVLSNFCDILLLADSPISLSNHSLGWTLEIAGIWSRFGLGILDFLAS